ncbi:hypothetical protein [Streptomyces tauricus]
MKVLRPRFKSLENDNILMEMIPEGRKSTDFVHAYTLPIPSFAISLSLSLGVP